MKKFVFLFLMLTFSPLTARDPESVKIPNLIDIEELKKGEKIRFSELSIKPDYDLFTDQRLVFMDTRIGPSFAPNVNLIGVSLGNGIFMDGDYNICLSLEKYFQANLNSKAGYDVIVTYFSGKNKSETHYIRNNQVIRATRGNKELFNATYADNKLLLKKPDGALSLTGELLSYTWEPAIGEPIKYEVAKSPESVTYSFGVPSTPLTVIENKISIDIPSDYFLSDIFTNRPILHIDIINHGDMITISNKQKSRGRNYTLIQNKNGLFIMNMKNSGFHIYKDEKKVIHVSEIKEGVKKEIMTIENLF